MQVINSRPFTIKKDIDTVFDLAGEPESARHFLSKVGDKPMFKDVSVADDAISAKLPLVGDITLRPRSSATRLRVPLYRWSWCSTSSPRVTIPRLKSLSK